MHIYDHDRSCYVMGSLSSLYDHGQSSHIQVSSDGGGSFRGYDFASGQYFNGRLSGPNVSLYDFATGEYYNLTV